MILQQARLIVLCGLPGSGKTALARQLEAEVSAIRLSADDWMESLSLRLHAEQDRDRVEKLQWLLAQRLLTLGNTVIIEWGTWGKWERDILRLRARELGAAVELRYLSAPPNELFRRIQVRNMEDPPIQWETMQRWAKLIQVPTEQEMELFDPPLPKS